MSEESSRKGSVRRDVLKALALAGGLGAVGTGIRLAVSNSDGAEDDLRKGMELHRDGKYEEAIALFAKVAESLPNDPLPHVLTGSAYANWGRYQDAVESFDQALECNCDDPVVHLYRGEALLQMGRKEEARRDFEVAKALAAGNEQVTSAANVHLEALGTDSLPKDATR